MEISRQQYLDELIRKKGNGLVKIVTGIRRCGKSYLLRTIFKNHLLNSGLTDDHIIEMAFDVIEGKKYRNPELFYEWAKNRIKDDMPYVFLLDEIQLMEEFESVLNGLNELKNTDIYVTGSNAKFLSRDIITEFAGRGDEVHLYPLSFEEFMRVYRGDNYHGFRDYMLYGGIPQVVLADWQDKPRLLTSLFEETYLRDIIKRNRIKNQSEVDELLKVLSSSIGSLTNAEKIKNTFKSVKHSKITSQTISRYLNCLEDAFLVEASDRYDIKGRAYIGTPRKYYFTDLGLRNAILNYRQTEPTHSMENIIYNELRVRGFRVDVGVVSVAERNEKGSVIRKQLEIDFVCNKNGKLYYIQSAYSIPDEEKRAQETRPFLKTADSFKKIIVTNDMTPEYYDENGIYTVNIVDFLLDKESMDK